MEASLFSAAKLKNVVRLKWINGLDNMIGIQQIAEYGRLSGATLSSVDVVLLAEAFGSKGLMIETPGEISSTLKKALATARIRARSGYPFRRSPPSRAIPPSPQT